MLMDGINVIDVDIDGMNLKNMNGEEGVERNGNNRVFQMAYRT